MYTHMHAQVRGQQWKPMPTFHQIGSEAPTQTKALYPLSYLLGIPHMLKKHLECMKVL